MIELYSGFQFWIPLGQIVAVNLALSGDNAVVIALAARSLPPARRKQAIFWGSLAAVAMRLGLTVIVFEMLRLPYMKISGGVLLLWIAVQVVVPDADEDQNHTGHSNLFASAGYVIMLANLAMSLDNVLGVAAAAADNNLMLALGLVISAMVIGFGSTFVFEIMARFPVIYPLCATLIGYLAGNMLVGDTVTKDWIHGHLHWLQSVNIGRLDFSVAGLIGAAAVLPMAKLYHFLTTRRGESTAAKGGNGLLNRFLRDSARFMHTRLAGSRILALLPFVIVIAVTYLGHPVYVYHKKRILSQISYYGISLGMAPDAVISVKGHPAYVVEDSTGDNRELLVKFEDIPKGKTVKDYSEWEFPIEGNEPGSLEVVYSRKTIQVTQIGCYSDTGYCLPVSGISTGASEDEVLEKLGAPQNVRRNKASQTFEYPNLHLSLLLKKKAGHYANGS